MAALFYGQARASPEDVARLTQLLGLSAESRSGALASQLTGFPDRGRAGPMPPVEPLIYRLYEIVQNYGYAFKAVMNEKFGDGIMSAICFSSEVEKEVVSVLVSVLVSGSPSRFLVLWLLASPVSPGLHPWMCCPGSCSPPPLTIIVLPSSATVRDIVILGSQHPPRRTRAGCSPRDPGHPSPRKGEE